MLSIVHGSYLEERGDIGSLQVIPQGFLRMLQMHPEDFFEFPSTAWGHMGFYSLIYVLLALGFVTDAKRHEHFNSETSAGAAHWNEDLKGFNRVYVEPVKHGQTAARMYMRTKPHNIPGIKLRRPERDACYRTHTGREPSKPPGKQSQIAQPANEDLPEKERRLFAYTDNNMILAQNIKFSQNDRHTRRNSNCLIIGGSGSGKTRFIVKPNMLQLNASYVVTDPSGELLADMGKLLLDAGYVVRVFNLVDMAHSNSYNPFQYINSDEDVLSMIHCLIANTTGKKPDAGTGDFWEKAETALLQSLVFYLRDHEPDEKKRNFTQIMYLLRLANVDKEGRTIDENNFAVDSQLDGLINAVRHDNPNDICVRQYDTYKMAAGRTAKSILISCGVRLTPFNLPSVENLTDVDQMELELTGDRKTAIFLIISQTDATYNFLASMLYSQLFNSLYRHAQAQKGRERLPVPVRCLLDEFANIGEIPDFPKMLATMRKYNISAWIILQGTSQLKPMYPADNGESVMGCCDLWIFLGGQEPSTLQTISNKCGKATIRTQSTSFSEGTKASGSNNFQYTARQLMMPEELSTMPNNKCIIFVLGEWPFYAEKYKLENHPRYCLTGDADKNRRFVLADDMGMLNTLAENKYTSLDLDAEAQRQAAAGTADPMHEPSEDEFMENILSQNHELRNKFFSSELMHIDYTYRKNNMDKATLPVLLRGPLPVSSLPFLAWNFYQMEHKEVILFADNDREINTLNGYLCDPENKFRETVFSRAAGIATAARVGHPGNDRRGVAFTISRWDYMKFIKSIADQVPNADERKTP